jgi:steroid Delta-isomerase
MNLDALIRYFHELTPQSLVRFPELYTEAAFFKDPFNEVRGVAAIQRIFAHMFEQIDEPRFVVTERLADDNSAMLVWELRYGKGQRIRGVSHLRFADDGRVAYHRDYWDAAEELYAKLPGIGLLMRHLRRRLACDVRPRSEHRCDQSPDGPFKSELDYGSGPKSGLRPTAGRGPKFTSHDEDCPTRRPK